MANQEQKSYNILFAAGYTNKTSDSAYRLQTPNNTGKWDNCQFYFRTENIEFDWLVVLDKTPQIFKKGIHQLSCPREHTILVTTEPSSISRYGRGFAKQFHYLITNQDEKTLPHANAIRSQTGIYWFYGKDFNTIIKDDFLPKTKLLSTVCSNKQDGHTMHKKRYDFTALMKKEIPELDRFGKGFTFVEKKYQALDDYKFHVVIENHIGKHMWSEKLADAFLGFTVPIYCGCPNIYDYFPEESLVQIDINKPVEAISIIKHIISTPGEYERRLEAVKEARRRVLYEYNLIAMITRIVNQSSMSTYTFNYKLHSRRYMRAKNIDDLFKYFGFLVSNFFLKIYSKIFK